MLRGPVPSRQTPFHVGPAALIASAYGGSRGFRRPGYVISIEPGLSYARGRSMIRVSAPRTMERNRKISTSIIMNHTHGDGAFADYTAIASYTRTF
jgi:hypothetical protein